LFHERSISSAKVGEKVRKEKEKKKEKKGMKEIMKKNSASAPTIGCLCVTNADATVAHHCDNSNFM